MPSVWIQLRKFLKSRGARLQTRSSHRVILTLDYGLYTEAENRTVSIENANLVVFAGRRIIQDLSQVESTLSQRAENVKARRLDNSTVMKARACIYRIVNDNYVH